MRDLNGYQAINEKYHLNGATILVDANRLLSYWQNGMADFAKQVPFTLNTTSGLGSLSKQFTADSVLLLNAAGALNIDAPLSDYLPEYRYATQITLRQMLHMASGIPDYTELLLVDYAKKIPNASESHLSYPLLKDLNHGDAFQKVVDLLNQHPLDFAPDEKGAYSNSNYFLLGHIIAEVAEMPLGDYLQQHFFQPLGMTKTRLGTKFSEANSYDDLDFTHGKPVALGRGDYNGGDGGVVSSLADLATWAQATLRRQVLPDSAWVEALTFTHDFYGMGWMKSKTRGWLAHNGHVFGYWAYFDVSFEKQLVHITLNNMSSGTEARKAWHREMADWLGSL
ncbi:serine hydrolase domain-containing protein [Lacticaseibacillus chiayiensis]|uniref:Beta-lactamase family protein n=3 Tax=Lacticaseibacillus chiayiensis TaxID=2100821 RepID=A0ABY6H698_9LACO|nr:serine hydrolase domain-containing protein [Lacticaseibacillus chiayiensis]QVI35113.1 beta-lactamase family protein [Lacticaseibacillus chiayiensis]UYN56897.1 beta-lactamase family protein [Lacticaseibacillus chiayiensis]